MSDRKAEKLVKNKWVPVESKDIKKGDIIRMLQPDGTLDRITGDGVRASSNAFKVDDNWVFHADLRPRSNY